MAELNAVGGEAGPGETRHFREVSKGYTIFRNRDLLVAKITPCFENNKIGQAKLQHGVGVGSSEFHVVRPKAGIAHDRYLLHFLRQDRVRVEGEQRMTGSGGQRRVPPAFLKDLKIWLPPLDEQRRVAAVLDQADVLRAKRLQVRHHVAELGCSIFADMFGGADAKWPVTTLGEIAKVKGGKRLPKGVKYALERTAHPYIRVVDFRAGVVSVEALEYLTPETHSRIARYTVGAGDVIVSIAGTIGLVAAVPKQLSGANLTENAAKIVPIDDSAYVGEWLAAMLRSPALQAQIRSYVGQVTIGKLALFRIEKLKFTLPPLQMQQEFVHRLRAAEGLAAHQGVGAMVLDELFESLKRRTFDRIV